MICMNYDHNKKFGLLKFHLGYGQFYFNSPMGYNRKIINVQTVSKAWLLPHSLIFVVFVLVICISYYANENM